MRLHVTSGEYVPEGRVFGALTAVRIRRCDSLICASRRRRLCAFRFAPGESVPSWIQMALDDAVPRSPVRLSFRSPGKLGGLDCSVKLPAANSIALRAWCHHHLETLDNPLFCSE